MWGRCILHVGDLGNSCSEGCYFLWEICWRIFWRLVNWCMLSMGNFILCMVKDARETIKTAYLRGPYHWYLTAREIGKALSNHWSRLVNLRYQEIQAESQWRSHWWNEIPPEGNPTPLSLPLLMPPPMRGRQASQVGERGERSPLDLLQSFICREAGSGRPPTKTD